MSLDQINDYSFGDENLTSMMETLDRQRRGYQAISLTHYDDNLECKIAAGSIFEIGGALFKTEGDEPITGWAGIGNDTDVYIKIMPSGSTATAAFVTAAPTWSTSKQGWYVGNDRYIGGLYRDSGGDYTIKWLYAPEDIQNLLREGQTRPILEKVVAIGVWNMDANLAPVDNPISLGCLKSKIRSVSVIILDDNVNAKIYPLDYAAGVGAVSGRWEFLLITDVADIALSRYDAGFFDSVNFDDAVKNRGWIYVKYRG